VLHQYVNDAVSELGHLEDAIRSDDVKAAVRLLVKAQHIYVLAQRRAFPIACYLSYALNQLELHTHLLDGVGGMLRESARAADARDVLLVASFRNYSPEVIDTAAACHRRGVPVIALTDRPSSPLLPFARVAFELRDDSELPFRSLVGPMCLAQALVVSTGYALADRSAGKNKNRSMSKEAQ
jgi:DNA-binding MurR/RpiR family transcriptional regulator